MKNLKKVFSKGKVLNKKGFTLVELIIVIVMLVAIAAIAIPAVGSFIERANVARVTANARSAYMALTVYAANELAENSISSLTVDTTALDAVKEIAGVSGVIAYSGSTIDNATVEKDDFSYAEAGYTATFDTNGNLSAVKTGSGGTTEPE